MQLVVSISCLRSRVIYLPSLPFSYTVLPAVMLFATSRDMCDAVSVARARLLRPVQRRRAQPRFELLALRFMHFPA